MYGQNGRKRLSNEATRVEFWWGIFGSSKFWRTEVRAMCVFNNKRQTEATELATKKYNWNGWDGALRCLSSLLVFRRLLVASTRSLVLQRMFLASSTFYVQPPGNPDDSSQWPV